jgi:hypothetical protein
MPETSQLSVVPTFNLRVSPALLSIEDTTDYTTINPSYTTVIGIFEVIAPNNVVIYQNNDYTNPDVTQSSNIKSGIQLPKDNNGNVIQGNYSIFFRVLIDGAYHYETITFNYQYTRIIGQLTIVADGFNSILSSTDSSNYAVYTIISQSRVHTVTPPPISPLSVVSGDFNVINYPPDIYSGLWTATIVNNIIYNINNIIIQDTIQASISQTVYYVIMSALNTWFKAYLSIFEKSSNIKEMTAMQKNLDIINSDLNIYRLSLDDNDLKGAYDAAYDVINILKPSPINVIEIIPFNNFKPSGQPIALTLNPNTTKYINVGYDTSAGVTIVYSVKRGVKNGTDIIRIPNDGSDPYTSEFGMMTIPNDPSENCGLTFGARMNGTDLQLIVNSDNSDLNDVIFTYFVFAM